MHASAISSLIVADWPLHYIIQHFKQFPSPEISMTQRASFPPWNGRPCFPVLNATSRHKCPAEKNRTGPGHYSPYWLDKRENSYHSEWPIKSTVTTLGGVQWLSDWQPARNTFYWACIWTMLLHPIQVAIYSIILPTT